MNNFSNSLSSFIVIFTPCFSTIANLCSKITIDLSRDLNFQLTESFAANIDILLIISLKIGEIEYRNFCEIALVNVLIFSFFVI